MWELAIVFDKNYVEALNTIKNKLQKMLKNTKHICTTSSQKEGVTLLLACEQEKKASVTKFLDEILSELFVSTYKEEYLKSHLKLNRVEEIKKQAFLKALTCFDRETDKKQVKQKLNYNETLYLKSFFAFKLNAIRLKWLDICELTNDNADFLQTPGTFIELLKFLIKNLKTKEKIVNINYDNKKFTFFNKEKKKINVKKQKNQTEDAFLVCNLILLNPQIIRFYYNDTVEVNTLHFLNEIFEEKIEFIKNK